AEQPVEVAQGPLDGGPQLGLLHHVPTLDALLALGVAGLTTADDCLATHGGLHLVDPEGQHLGDVPEDVAPIPPLAGLGIGRPVLAASAGRDLTQPGPRLTCPVA